MSESHTRPADDNYVNPNESWQVLKYWTKELDCNEHELRDAVRAVGREVHKVRGHLHRQRT